MRSRKSRSPTCRVLNLFNEAWAYRIGNASVIASAYAPLRRAFLRVQLHF
jgi:hypothetical protein